MQHHRCQPSIIYQHDGSSRKPNGCWVGSVFIVHRTTLHDERDRSWPAAEKPSAITTSSLAAELPPSPIMQHLNLLIVLQSPDAAFASIARLFEAAKR